MEPTTFTDHYGSRLHRIQCGAGPVTFGYRATVTGQGDLDVASDIDLVTFMRPSRYCESDTLDPTAAAEFGSLEGHALLAAVASWVHDKLYYVSGSSLPTDGAVRTLLARQGVCRDFAHLTIALLRARDVPARLVSVYAPGLSPMDFHAVCEAWVDGAWHLVDATWLAPRQTLVRIATGPRRRRHRLPHQPRRRGHPRHHGGLGRRGCAPTRRLELAGRPAVSRS